MSGDILNVEFKMIMFFDLNKGLFDCLSNKIVINIDEILLFFEHPYWTDLL